MAATSTAHSVVAILLPFPRSNTAEVAGAQAFDLYAPPERHESADGKSGFGHKLGRFFKTKHDNEMKDDILGNGQAVTEQIRGVRILYPSGYDNHALVEDFTAFVQAANDAKVSSKHHRSTMAKIFAPFAFPIDLFITGGLLDFAFNWREHDLKSGEPPRASLIAKGVESQSLELEFIPHDEVKGLQAHLQTICAKYDRQNKLTTTADGTVSQIGPAVGETLLGLLRAESELADELYDTDVKVLTKDFEAFVDRSAQAFVERL